MDEVKESCPLHVTLICRLYYPFPWSQISHNSCSFFAHCIQVFSLVNVPDDARQKSGRCWRTYCNMFDSPLPALDITAAFVVVPALPKYVFFSSSPGINFTHQNMGWGGCFFLLPFPASDCAEDSRKRQTWEAVQSNPHCGISVRRPQNILRPSSSSRRRRLLASDSSADRGVFTLGRLGTHFVFVPCQQLFDPVT